MSSDDDESKKRIEDDLKFSRDTYNDLVASGMEAIERMTEVAKDSEHPRAYEVLSKLMKDTADIADKLMEVNRKYRDVCLDKSSDRSPALLGESAQTNNFFVGSTTDLQRLLIRANEEKDVTPDGDS